MCLLLLLLLKREVSQTIYTSACQQMMSMEMDLRVSLLSSPLSLGAIQIFGWGLLRTNTPPIIKAFGRENQNAVWKSLFGREEKRDKKRHAISHTLNRWRKTKKDFFSFSVVLDV